MISVLIPVYNGVEFLTQSLGSAYHQTYRDIEIIIGINGYPAKSPVYQTAVKIAQRYGDDRIQVVDLTEARGKGSALNKMVKIAQYPYVALLDVDDVWQSTKLAEQLPYLQQGYHVVGSLCHYFGDRHDISGLPTGDITGFDFLRLNPVINSSAIVRRELAWWDPECFVEDYQLWLRLWRRGCRFYNVDKSLTMIRISQNSFFNPTNGQHVGQLRDQFRQPVASESGATTQLPVVISYSNIGYRDFAENLLLNLDQVTSNHRVHFYCLDRDIYDALTKLKSRLSRLASRLTLELVDLDLSRSFERYNSSEYCRITHTKTGVIRKALERYGYVHFVDCDVVCIHEPSSDYYRQYRDYDIVFQHDAGFHARDQLHAPTLNHIWTCTGNTTFRDTAGTKAIISAIERYQQQYPDKNDQECLYQYFLDLHMWDLSQHPTARLATYPVEQFTNGYWLGHDIGTLDATYFFHANHVSGRDAKIALLKKAGKWVCS